MQEQAIEYLASEMLYEDLELELRISTSNDLPFLYLLLHKHVYMNVMIA